MRAPVRRRVSPRPGGGRCAPAAFTLLELILVLVLLGVLAFLAVTNYFPTLRAEQLTESTRRLKALFAMCRAEAMNDAKVYRVIIRADGQVVIAEQQDPVTAPNAYPECRAAWARTQMLLDGVWIHAVQRLPDGPPPILVSDEKIEFTELEDEPIAVADIAPLAIDFLPDGGCNSVRFDLRDSRGYGARMTLDGRLGRVTMETLDPLEEDQIERPPPLAEAGADATGGLLTDAAEVAGRTK